MGGPPYLTWRTKNGRWSHKSLSSNKDKVAFRVKHGSIKQQKRREVWKEWREWGRRKRRSSLEFTAVEPPIQGCWWGWDSSQWDSVLGQGSASGYDQLFKSFFWLRCPFSTMNARCKAPADALYVVTDYSWLTNSRAGSAPINPAGFSPMPLQGDRGGVPTGEWEE